MNSLQILSVVLASLCLAALGACSDERVQHMGEHRPDMAQQSQVQQSDKHRGAPLAMQYRWLTPPTLEVPASLQIDFHILPGQLLALTELPVASVLLTGLPTDPLLADDQGKVTVTIAVTALSAGRHYVKLLAAVGEPPHVSQRALAIALTVQGTSEDNAPPADAAKMPASRF
jgi:hypothetical protein